MTTAATNRAMSYSERRRTKDNRDEDETYESPNSPVSPVSPPSAPSVPTVPVAAPSAPVAVPSAPVALPSAPVASSEDSPVAAPVADAPVSGPVAVPSATEAVPSAPTAADSPVASVPIPTAPVVADASVTDSPVAAPVSTTMNVTVPTTADELAAACEALESGETYETNQKYDIAYYYELVTPIGAELNDVVDALEPKVAAWVAGFVVPCTRRQLLSQNQRQLTPLGVGPGARDELADSGRCTNLSYNSTSQDCYYMKGTLDFFLSKGSSYSQQQASDFSYQLLAAGFDYGDRLKVNPLLDESQGIVALAFRGAASSDDNGQGTKTIETPAAAERTVPSEDSNSLGGLGAAIVVVACVGLLVVAIFGMKRRAKNFAVKRALQEEADGLELQADEEAYTNAIMIHEPEIDTEQMH